MVRCNMSDDDRCPSCWKRHERADHLCKCRSAARTKLLESSVDDLVRWMSVDCRTDTELMYWLPKYIRGRGAVTFSELGQMSTKMTALAHNQDLIGWRNFMEGRVSTHFFRLQQDHLDQGSHRINATDWMRGFITKILHMTHAQWLLRNFMLHDYKLGYLTVKNRIGLLHQIDRLSHTQVHEVPEESRFLLEIDINHLAHGHTEDQEYWVSAMEAARHAGQTPVTDPVRDLLPIGPPMSVGGVFSLLEEIRQEWREVRIQQKTSFTPYPVQSEGVTAALLASNRARKPD